MDVRSHLNDSGADKGKKNETRKLGNGNLEISAIGLDSAAEKIEVKGLAIRKSWRG